MKKVINNEGVEIEVSIDTPTKLISGKRYLLTAQEIQEAVQKDIEEAERIPKNKIKDKIKDLENEITIRRLREAILGIDNGWLANQESLIITERNKL